MSSAATTQLPKSYVPAEHEAGVRARAEASGVYHAEPGGDRPPYCILIPPPNVTAGLHLGHAFNNTLQDVLTRVHRMRGFNTLWMPGTDHAGIATQAVVEKRLLAQGTRRRDMGRDAFVDTVQAWKDEYEATITEQLKAMGASCDWARQRFTMDPVCVRAVREAFFRLFADGLIYRGKRLVNWDPVTQTALADDEVEMREVDGSFWYLKYPIVDDAGGDTGAFVTVATTRPETMLGDTAVAVNPRDPERASLIGQRVRLPIVDRIVPIIGDDYVVRPDPDSSDPKAQFASGFLKVTPAHDPNDWEIGLRHDLPVINVMAPDATISGEHGWPDVTDAARRFVGMSREDARRAVATWFADHDLLAERRPYRHSVGHSYRSHEPIEPYLSDQWYVRVSDDALVGSAQRALAAEQFDGDAPAGVTPGDGELRFFPARYARTYQAWHENLRDWCISRQLWWGHQLPVWLSPEDSPGDDAAIRRQLDPYVREGRLAYHAPGDIPAPGLDPARTWWLCVRREDDDELVAAIEALGCERDPDVLDTWFSSGLWPLSTMGWPDPDPDAAGLLETFNPTSVLCTAREIITLWVSRMVMFNRYFNDGVVPFRHVYIHAMIQDGHGQKMSKSLGNGVDPRDIIASHGADALRFTMTQMATGTQDVKLPVDTQCPGCEATFHPAEHVNASGHRVAEAVLTCPSCGTRMNSAYGLATGAADESLPAATNSSNKFDSGRRFANKIWNATRFALTILEDTADEADPTLTLADRPLVDRWIVSRLHSTLHEIEDALETYQFNVYANAIYKFTWGDFCDWYLEAIKPTVRADAGQRQVLRTVLSATIRLLHPICPFVTETLWPHVRGVGIAGIDGIELPLGPPEQGLAACGWPDIACRIHDADAVTAFERLQTLAAAVQSLRDEHGVPDRRALTLHAPPAIADLIDRGGPTVATRANLEQVVPRSEERPEDAIPFAFEGEELLLSGLTRGVDVAAERARLDKLIAEKEKAIDGYRRKLANEGYVRNAPEAVVAETRDRQAAAEADLAAAQTALRSLEASA
ncbi:MAG: valine--tRNA ligase [Phycisphaerales bacterium]|nr:valine--tRNA ligase [Phycisphaerae bacterium]NNM27517.1 valine--tRNA ligase [Phycisphaerales bacterium]